MSARMLAPTEKELCYLTPKAFLFIAELQHLGIEDFDVALELAREVLGDDEVYSLEDE